MPEINLDEIERRLRAAGGGSEAVEDPLEELTRLVGSIVAQQPAAARVPFPVRAENNNDFAALRPSFDETEEPESAPEFEAPLPPAHEASAPPPQARKFSWYVKMGGLVGAAAILIAGAAVLKWNGATNPTGAPPLILAAKGPDKIAPPDEKAAASPSDTGALLNKDSLNNSPVKVIDNREQPLAANPAPSPIPSKIAAPADSPVATNMNAPIIATPMAPAPPSAPIFTTKKPVRTVSVRPDGTLIAVDQAPVANRPSPTPTSAPAKVEAAPVVEAQPASPGLDLPAPKSSKTTNRPPVAKTDTTGPAEQVNSPMQLDSAKPQKLPTKLRPPEADQAAADATPAPVSAPPVGSGDWSVQLAAPRSEADARSAIQRLQTKFSDALGDASLGVRKADKDGETIYRVRTSGMAKTDAVAMCARIKGDGGDCFVTKN